MVTSNEISKRIRILEEHPAAYIKSRIKEFEEAAATPDWATTHIKKKIEKELRSNEHSSGYGALLTARSRAPFMIYWAQSKIIEMESENASLIHRALKNVWWAFKCRPETYGDYESIIQLLVPWFAIAGDKAKSDFIGSYICGISNIIGHEQYLQTSIGKFIAALWAIHNQDKHPILEEKLLESTGNDHYDGLIKNIDSKDNELVENMIYGALDYHIRSSSTENGELRTSFPFYLLPVEIYYYIDIRLHKGLSTTAPKHPIFGSNLSSAALISDTFSSGSDDLLLRAIGHAIKLDWITQSDLAKYGV